ncbi:hypothetical protein BH23CHL2_BH23CHL2_27340 [soil metagenome]
MFARERLNQMERMLVSRRALLRGALGVSALGLLAACGDEDEDDAANGQADQPDPTATEASSDNAETPTPDEDDAENGETRTVEHAMGTTEVPANPERVVVLDMGEMDMALALGVQPVGAALYTPEQDFADYLQGDIGEYTRVGTVGEPDLEAILALDPDLIISNKLRHEVVYDELSKIAPTVFAESLGADWKATFETVARALGKEDEHQQVMDEYWGRIEAFQDAMGGDLDRMQVSIVRSFPDHIRLYMKDSFIGRIVEDTGLQRPPSQDKEIFMEEISAEHIRDLAADVIFLLYWNPSQGEQLSTLIDNPLWTQLAAVEAAQVFEMDDEVWGTGLGPLAAMEVISDLEQVFIEGDIVNVWDPEGEATDQRTFPIEIEHKFGMTEVPSEPQRVVTIGFSEQDPVLALGVKPVAVRDWFGDQPFAVWPWAQDELGDAEPEVLQMPFGELDFELIAGLEPELIVATHSGILEEEYNTLSRIAPTLAQSGDYPDFGMSWQEQTSSIGRALGLEQEAEELVAEVEQIIADAAAAHPEFDGATVAWASPDGSGGFWAVGPTTPPLRFLQGLGFAMSDELAEVIGDLDSAQISGEQLGLLDADVLIVQAGSEEGRETIESDPLYQQLDVAREGRTIFFTAQDDPIYGALSFSTVLSLPYAVEHLVPLLEAAVDGDPETETGS